MLLYWNLLERAVERGQSRFDFGRCTPGGSVHRFKEQWGGRALPAEWQSALGPGFRGSRTRGDSLRAASRIWKALPVPIARCVGPHLARGLL